MSEELIATKIFEMLDDLVLGEETPIELNELLTPQQKYELTYAIIRALPKRDLKQVEMFHEAFKVPKETTHVVADFKYAELRFALILEETLELGKALGFSNDNLYRAMMVIYTDVKNKKIIPGIYEVADALTDLRVVLNGTSDVFNLGDINQALLEEVTSSNMSKLIPADHPDLINIATKSRQFYADRGIETLTEDLKNGYVTIKNKETGKILKPVTYVAPDLKTIINNHLNN